MVWFLISVSDHPRANICAFSQGLFRYYEGSSMLSAAFVAHLLDEDAFEVFAIIAARDPGANVSLVSVGGR